MESLYEFLDYVLQDNYHLIGTAIISYVILSGIADIIRSLRR